MLFEQEHSVGCTRPVACQVFVLVFLRVGSCVVEHLVQVTAFVLGLLSVGSLPWLKPLNIDHL